MQTSSASVIFVCDHTHECWLGNAVTVTSGASWTRSPPATGSSCSRGTPCSRMTRTVSYEPRTFAPVFRAIVSAPQRWSKCEWPTTIQSARSTSPVVRPTVGAEGTRSRYASRKTTRSSTVRRNVAQPSQSSAAATTVSRSRCRRPRFRSGSRGRMPCLPPAVPVRQEPTPRPQRLLRRRSRHCQTYTLI